MSSEARRQERYRTDPEYRAKRKLTSRITEVKRSIRYHEERFRYYTELLVKLSKGDAT